MKKIKMTLQCRVPSWNFCNCDIPTDNYRFSKEVCRFCVVTKSGCYCALHDCRLTSDSKFIHKTSACIDATAGFAITVDEPTPIQVDPKLIVRESIKGYTKTLNDLLKQGYPRAMAEMLATKYMTGDT